MSKAEYLKPLEKLSQLWEKGHCPPPAVLPLLAVITVLFQYSNEQFPYFPASPCSVMYNQHQHIHSKGEFTSILRAVAERSMVKGYFSISIGTPFITDSPQMGIRAASVGFSGYVFK